MVVYCLELRKGSPEHEHRATQCFTLIESDERDNELQSVFNSQT